MANIKIIKFSFLKIDYFKTYIVGLFKKFFKTINLLANVFIKKL